MGWAIKRLDGTYRCWNANTQDDVLQPGEVWESLPTAPVITVPPPPASPLAAALDTLLTIPTPNVQQIVAVLRIWRRGIT